MQCRAMYVSFYQILTKHSLIQVAAMKVLPLEIE